jgi:hypothetical protein
MQGWWLDVLMRGKLPGLLPDERPNGYWTCPSASIFDLYLYHAQKQGNKRRSLEVKIGMFLKNHVPGLRKREREFSKAQVSDVKNIRTKPFRDNVYDFPPLATCRKAFDEKLQQDFEWPEQSDWTEWPTDLQI